ncbi:MAG: hypothetical protein OXT73_00400 [Bacteroidota bacterium]|nr:hypothetical protein [Bacteroidota bacterium]
MKRTPLLLLLGLFLAACSSPTSSLDTEDAAVESSELFAPFGAKKGDTAYGDPLGQPAEECNDANYRPFTYTLWAVQSNDAGTVTVSTDGDNLLITYDTNETADLEEVHVYMYTDAADVPDRRPAPGRAPYKAENLYVDAYTVSVPLSDLLSGGDVLCDQTFYVIAHTALTTDETGSNENAGETAYSGGNNNPGKGAWFYISEYANFCDCQTDECVVGGDLIAGQYNDIRSITITEDDTDILITYEITEIDPATGQPYPLGELQIYVFTDPAELDPSLYPGGRPTPGQAPYKVSADDLDGASTYTVRIPKSDFDGACPLYIAAKTTVNGETTYGGLLGETGIGVGAPGAWWYYLTFGCCS